MNKIIFLTLLLAIVFCEPEYEEKDGVLILTDDNFDAVVNHFEHVLVMFYAPWCGHCKKLHPEFETAAQQLEQDGSEIRLANVDATVHSALAQRFEVQGYPTLKFMVGGSPMDYNGPRDSAGILKWVVKKTSPATTLLEDVESVEKAKADNKVVVVFCGPTDSEEFALYSRVAMKFDLVFHHVTNTDVATELGVEGTGLVLFKQFDEGRVDYAGDWVEQDLQDWMDISASPTIIPFDQGAAQLIFGQGKTCLFLFTDDSEASQAASAALVEASATLKGQVLMSTSGVVGGLDARLAEYIGVTSADVPAVRLVVVGQDLSKYNMDGELTAENMVQFWQDFQAGNVKKHLKSEPVPETQNDAVHVLVGNSWNDVVLDETQDVLVEYYAPWCGHCKALAPVYEALAQKLSVVDNLVIAKMDSTANEAEGVQIKGFPTLKFYPANNKTPVDFDGSRDEAGLLSFLREKSSKVVNWDQLDNVEEDTASEEVEAENEVKDEL